MFYSSKNNLSPEKHISKITSDTHKLLTNIKVNCSFMNGEAADCVGDLTKVGIRRGGDVSLSSKRR